MGEQREAESSEARWKFFSLPVLGLIAYAICYSTLSRFYTELGTSPDAVGLDYRTVLSRSVGLLTFTLILAGPLLLVGRTVGKRSRRHTRPLARSLPVVMAAVVIAIGMLSYKLLGRAVDHRDSQVLAGKPVAPISFLGTSLISIHVYPATITAVSGAEAMAAVVADDQLLYVGTANGNVVLFDAQKERTITVPLADIVLSVRPIHAPR